MFFFNEVYTIVKSIMHTQKMEEEQQLLLRDLALYLYQESGDCL